MSRMRLRLGALVVVWGVGCDASRFHPELRPVDVRSDEPTARERLAACEQDPRVRSGLVARELCADAVVFAGTALDSAAGAPADARARRDALDRNETTRRRVLPATYQPTRVDFWFVISPNSRPGGPRATSGT